MSVLDPGLLFHHLEPRDVAQRLASAVEAALDRVLPADGATPTVMVDTLATAMETSSPVQLGLGRHVEHESKPDAVLDDPVLR